MSLKKTVTCPKCSSPDTFVIFEHQYNSLRGHYKKCKLARI